MSLRSRVGHAWQDVLRDVLDWRRRRLSGLSFEDVSSEATVKTILLLLAGILLGGFGVMLWLVWYFRDVMK
jgi:hypothetical protein